MYIYIYIINHNELTTIKDWESSAIRLTRGVVEVSAEERLKL